MRSISDIKAIVGPADMAVQTSKTNRMHQLIALGVLMLAPLGAGAQQFGDWVVESNRDITEAITRNSNGSALGYACSRASDECLFFFTPDKLKCTEGSHYTVLINGGNHNNS
jgi:hypothetical protein